MRLQTSLGDTIEPITCAKALSQGTKSKINLIFSIGKEGFNYKHLMCFLLLGIKPYVFGEQLLNSPPPWTENLSNAGSGTN